MNAPTNRFDDLTIVVPALNEAEHIEQVLLRIAACFPGAELILVDNGSTDETSLRGAGVPGVRVMREPRRGKGNAMRTGAQAATRELLMFHDADLEYSAEDGVQLVHAVRAQPRAMACGVRATNFGSPQWSSLVACALIRALLSWRFGSQALHGCDILCGTRVLSLKHFQQLQPSAADFRIETQLVRQALQAGMPLEHRLISYSPRSRSEGKKIRPRHIFGLIREALRAA